MRWILKKTLSLVIRHSQLRRFWRLRLEGERIPAILVEYFDSIAKHENSAHLLLLKLASFGIYPLRGTYDVSLFNFCGQPQQASLSSVPPSSDANVLFIATFQKKAFKIVNTLSLSNIDKLVEIEREAWISCPRCARL